VLGLQSADAIFDLLPIHADLRPEDREMFQNSVRFAICGVFDAMTRSFDVPALEAALVSSAGEQRATPPSLPGAS
jgi:hypothetical protein